MIKGWIKKIVGEELAELMDNVYRPATTSAIVNAFRELDNRIENHNEIFDKIIEDVAQLYHEKPLQDKSDSLIALLAAQNSERLSKLSRTEQMLSIAEEVLAASIGSSEMAKYMAVRAKVLAGAPQTKAQDQVTATPAEAPAPAKPAESAVGDIAKATPVDEDEDAEPDMTPVKMALPQVGESPAPEPQSKIKIKLKS